MIVFLQRFVEEERPYWNELERMLERGERDIAHRMSLDELKRFHYLYRRASSDLGNLAAGTSEPRVKRYLESLVARAYGEIHETRERRGAPAMRTWIRETFPRTFRRRFAAFLFATAILGAGSLFGAGAILADPEAKAVIMPFQGLNGDPAARVRREETNAEDPLEGAGGRFSAMLMTNNIRVSINTLASGLTCGVLTFVLLFYNGVILGAVAADYIHAGQATFLAGWLLPHGVVEIPSILIAGQAGFLLARALVGWERSLSLRERLRLLGPDLVTLVIGLSLLLVWAGLIESFFSQYHEPVLPYGFKIAFGCLEAACLVLYLARAGRAGEDPTEQR